MTRLKLRHALTSTLASVLALSAVEAAAAEDSLLRFAPVKGGMALADRGQVVPVIVAPQDAANVRHAAEDLAKDLGQVSGHAARLLSAPEAKTPAAIIIGTLGQSPLIDAMVRAGKIQPASLTGQWESFLILTVEKPLAGVDRALVVVGSDRRGTAYGAYEVSRAMGVSPWSWWADLAPRHQDAIYAPKAIAAFS
jgi:hypothetical protein